MTKPILSDKTATAHAVVFFACGALMGGGTDLIATHFFGPETGQLAGFCGFAAGLGLAWVITRRWFPDEPPSTGP